MKTYLEQLETRCAALGITLEDACKATGIDRGTPGRWRKGLSTCREDTFLALRERMKRMRPATRRKASETLKSRNVVSMEGRGK